MPLYAYIEPRQLKAGAQGKVSFSIENLHATADIYLHPEYEKPLSGWKIPATKSIPVFEWVGGLLWISASANNVSYQVLDVEPARGKEQEKGSGATGSGGGGGGGGLPPAGGSGVAPGGGGGGYGGRPK